jgi:hypothetical protein
VSRWNLHHGVVPFTVFLTVWHNFYCGENKTRDSGSTVAWGSVAPLPLWSQNREPDVRMTRIQRQGGRFLDEVEVDKIGEEGRSVCHLSGSGFGSPSTSFGEKTRGTFFWFVR